MVRGPGPSARSNHVAALYDDKLLLVFGGTSKSKSLNDLYSLDFETVRIETIVLSSYHFKVDFSEADLGVVCFLRGLKFEV